MARRLTLISGVRLGLAVYNEETALKLANLAVAANCAPPALTSTQALEAWQCGPACDAVPGVRNVRAIDTVENDDAFAFVGELDDKCLLVFRGTSNKVGWLMDAESGFKVNLNDHGIECNVDGKPCRGAWGFTKNYANLRGFIIDHLIDLGCASGGKQVVVTGHSLGAAEAHLAMYDLSHNGGFEIAQTYSFGAPRPGDATFVKAFEKEIPLDMLYRVTHYYDPVPHLPPMSLGFAHPPREVFYGENVSDGYIECDGSGSDSMCANQFWDVASMLAACVWDGVMNDGCDHLTYFKGAIPYQMNGQSCVDPFAEPTTEPVRDSEASVVV